MSNNVVINEMLGVGGDINLGNFFEDKTLRFEGWKHDFILCHSENLHDGIGFCKGL